MWDVFIGEGAGQSIVIPVCVCMQVQRSNKGGGDGGGRVRNKRNKQKGRKKINKLGETRKGNKERIIKKKNPIDVAGPAVL